MSETKVSKTLKSDFKIYQPTDQKILI